MRRKDREIADKSEQYAILDDAPVMHLGLVDGDEPYVVPLNFVRIEDALYFHCAKEGRKLDLIRAGSKACFEVTGKAKLQVGAHACDCSTLYESVVGWGSVAMLGSDEEKSAALAALNRKFGAPEGPFPAAMLDAVEVVRIRIERLTGKAKRGKM